MIGNTVASRRQTARRRVLAFRGPGSAVGTVLAATVAWVVSGGRGFYVGLAIGGGWILGDLADRVLVARGVGSAATLARIGRWIQSAFGVIGLALGAFLLVSFFLTGLPVVLAGAAVACVAGGLLLWRG